MKKYSLNQLSSLFYKYAINMPDWVPEKFRKELLNYNVKKNVKLKDFVIDNINIEDLIDVSPGSYYKFRDNLINNIEGLKLIANFINLELNEHHEANETLIKAEIMLQSFYDQISRNDDILYYGRVILNKNEYKLQKAYSMLKDVVTKIATDVMKKYGENKTNMLELLSFEDFELIEGKKQWDNRFIPSKNKKYKIVFTTDPSNIIGMSSRSSWTSCQNIFGESEIGKANINSLIGSVLCEDVAMIYLTDSTQHKRQSVELGDEIIYRRMVYLVLDENDNEFILLQKQYPNDNRKVKNLFINALKSQLSLEVITEDSLDKTVFLDTKSLPKEIQRNPDKLPYVDYSSNSIGGTWQRPFLLPDRQKHVELYKKLSKLSPNDIHINSNNILKTLEQSLPGFANNKNKNIIAVKITGKLQELAIMFIKERKNYIYEIMEEQERNLTDLSIFKIIEFFTRKLFKYSSKFEQYVKFHILAIFDEFGIKDVNMDLFYKLLNDSV